MDENSDVNQLKMATFDGRASAASLFSKIFQPTLGTMIVSCSLSTQVGHGQQKKSIHVTLVHLLGGIGYPKQSTASRVCSRGLKIQGKPDRGRGFP